jgi:hypothetical protein
LRKNDRTRVAKSRFVVAASDFWKPPPPITDVDEELRVLVAHSKEGLSPIPHVTPLGRQRSPRREEIEGSTVTAMRRGIFLGARFCVFRKGIVALSGGRQA